MDIAVSTTITTPFAPSPWIPHSHNTPLLKVLFTFFIVDNIFYHLDDNPSYHETYNIGKTKSSQETQLIENKLYNTDYDDHQNKIFYKVHHFIF